MTVALEQVQAYTASCLVGLSLDTQWELGVIVVIAGIKQQRICYL